MLIKKKQKKNQKLKNNDFSAGRVKLPESIVLNK